MELPLLAGEVRKGQGDHWGTALSHHKSPQKSGAPRAEEGARSWGRSLGPGGNLVENESWFVATRRWWSNRWDYGTWLSSIESPQDPATLETRDEAHPNKSRSNRPQPQETYWFALEDLDGLRGGGSVEPGIKSSRSWAKWSEGDCALPQPEVWGGEPMPTSPRWTWRNGTNTFSRSMSPTGEIVGIVWRPWVSPALLGGHRMLPRPLSWRWTSWARSSRGETSA